MQKTKLNDTNSVITYFGKLTKVDMTPTMLSIHNEDGEVRMMSVKKYKDMAQRVRKQAEDLIGQCVDIRTSQATGNWSANKWFSGIKKAGD